MKRFFAILLAFVMVLSMCACGMPTTYPSGGTAVATADPTSEPVRISYIAELYDNHGSQWLAVEGTSFGIQPNKVKECAYSSDGYWEWNWTTSSVMSITVDGQHIESCGSTALFYDTRLEKVDFILPDEVTLSVGSSAQITAPSDNYNWVEDRWGLMYWYWNTEKQANTTPAARLVVIQSQEGDPICMFAGDEVYWSVSRNLPKTTELMIDGKVVYIHRANFSIIDTSVFE